MARIKVDPVTRIEGHLRVDVEVGGGKVTKAWSSAQMFRGIETILQGRDPRDAWVFAQRFCGVCTTTHALASVRAVEDALKVEIPLNAQYIRNIITSAHCVQDHIVHFYHLSALDWVDIVSALKADPAKAAQIAQGYSDWSGNNVHEFTAAKERLAAFVQRGKLGIFGNAYWGHPAMKLPPEVNLIAFSHYLKALDYQRMASQAVAVLGGKEPHIQNLCVGGVATAINVDNPATLNFERIALVRENVLKAQEFVNKVYIPDVLAVASFYPEWFSYGAGVTNYMSVPEFPTDTKNSAFLDKGGLITEGAFTELKDWNNAAFRNGMSEDTAHAWYTEATNLHPYKGKSEPKYTDFEDNGKYTWCKAPRYNGKPYQVGPLAQILAAYTAGDQKTVGLVNGALSAAKLKPAQLHSTLGRHAARAIRCSIMADRAIESIDMLCANIANGDQTYANHVTEFPKGRFEGVGMLEAPRGFLSHWIVIEDGKIANYQAVVPSTWNAGPKDAANVASPYEASLLGNPIADEHKPLEVIRTIHSFDPCIACAVHAVDPEG
ncbi:MAG: nickel-dependent hydrogenase large subunit, partial [Deferribacteraceae bacterium]|nr:nickel-dependent hydrogenase large subunit [Deferribacteraceae bacterium]